MKILLLAAISKLMKTYATVDKQSWQNKGIRKRVKTEIAWTNAAKR